MSKIKIKEGTFTGAHIGDNIQYIQIVGGDSPEVSIDIIRYLQGVRHRFSVAGSLPETIDVVPVSIAPSGDMHRAEQGRSTLRQSLAEHRRIILLGEAGSGKTTLLQRLGFDAGDSGSIGSPSLQKPCIYIELSRYRCQSPFSALDALLNLFSEQLYLDGATQKPLSLGAVRTLLAEESLLLLLDGLNEVHPDLRRHCMQSIVDLTRLYPDCGCVLTARPQGFANPLGWPLYAPCLLEPQQVERLLTASAAPETKAVILAMLKSNGNSILLMPLFIGWVNRMEGMSAAALKRGLGSRSWLVNQYANYLLQRDDVEKGLAAPASTLLAQMHEILAALAREVQRVGQSLTISEARMAAASFGNDRDALIEILCQRGILTSDGHYLRFSHHTLHEYFCARALVVRWRGDKRVACRIPRWLATLIRKGTAADTMANVIACVEPMELRILIPFVSKFQPTLAIIWLDDLCSEERDFALVEETIVRIRNAIRKRLWIGDLQGGLSFFMGLPEQSLLSTQPFFLFLYFFGTYINAWILSNNRNFDEQWNIYLVLLMGLFLGIPIAIHHIIRCAFPIIAHRNSMVKIYELFGIWTSIRNIELRIKIKNTIAELSHEIQPDSPFLAAALGALHIDEISDLPRLLSLSHRSNLYGIIQIMGYVNSTSALPLLRRISRYRNAFSRVAVDALVVRAQRFPEEVKAISEIGWSIWRDKSICLSARAEGRRLLIGLGVQPGGTILIILQTAAELFGISLAVAVSTYLLGKLSLALPISFCIAGIVFLDSYRLGARRIPGSPTYDSFGPSFYLLSTYLLSPALAAIMYLINRQSIERNSSPMELLEISENKLG